MKNNKKIAVVLFNMGGPSSLKAVRTFLFNLFYDPQIIRLPNPFRFFIASLISYFRNSKAMEIYKLIGGKSPILEITNSQARKLEDTLNTKDTYQYKVFVCMRYSAPFTSKTANDVMSYNPNEVILLPLYPQYSTTTSLSSIKEWFTHIEKNKYPTKVVCCYGTHPSFIKSWSNLIIQEYKKAAEFGTPRLLFSAHSLPISIINSGDPYSLQIEKSVKMIVNYLQEYNLDWRICYQSKVGPVKWLEPSTENEILKANSENIPIVIVPIAFVSEHSETLVELDIEYRNLATKSAYFRVPTPAIDDDFIECLKELCMTNNFQHCCSKDCWQNLKHNYSISS